MLLTRGNNTSTCLLILSPVTIIIVVSIFPIAVSIILDVLCLAIIKSSMLLISHVKYNPLNAIRKNEITINEGIWIIFLLCSMISFFRRICVSTLFLAIISFIFLILDSNFLIFRFLTSSIRLYHLSITILIPR